MKLQSKIIIISLAATIVIGFILNGMYNSHSGDMGLIVFAITAAIVGIAEIFLGVILLFHPDKKYAQSFLASGGIIFLIGFVTCTAGIHR